MNPNEYDDEAYAKASVEMDAMALWAAGAEPDDIAEQLGNWLSDDCGLKVEVSITVEA